MGKRGRAVRWGGTEGGEALLEGVCSCQTVAHCWQAFRPPRPLPLLTQLVYMAVFAGAPACQEISPPNPSMSGWRVQSQRVTGQQHFLLPISTVHNPFFTTLEPIFVTFSSKFGSKGQKWPKTGLQHTAQAAA